MTAAETMQLLGGFAIVGALLWSFQRWDERRMDRALKEKYPNRVPVVHPLSWDEKRVQLERALERAHETTDTQDFMPFVGYLAAMSLGFRWLGWAGVLGGIPVGAVLYYLIKTWMGRDRTKAARALADHLGKDRGGNFPV